MTGTIQLCHEEGIRCAATSGTVEQSRFPPSSYAGELMDRRCWKHSRQNTGRPCVGLKGTVVSLPHWEQTVRVSTLAKPPPFCPCPVGTAPSTDTRFVLHALHRLGSFLNCLSWKNNCSPAVKIKSAPQSMHFNTLSWNSIERCSLQPSLPTRETTWGRASAQVSHTPLTCSWNFALDAACHPKNSGMDYYLRLQKLRSPDESFQPSPNETRF